jgi:chorismate--pyruvate lyase
LTPRSQLFLKPPRWVRVRHHGNRPIPPRIASWLFEPGSLTRRLRHLCGAGFRVRLLRQGWCKPYADEARILYLATGRRAVVREVALQWGERPLVVARSIIPAKTLKGVDRRLAHLGTRPLGEILFADPRLQKKSLELTEVPAPRWNKELRNRLDLSPRTWGRRSLYALGRGHRLLVAEFFLPELFDLEQKP